MYEVISAEQQHAASAGRPAQPSNRCRAGIFDEPPPALLRAETAQLRRLHLMVVRAAIGPASRVQYEPAACQDRGPAGSTCGSGPRPLPGPRVFTASADCLSRGGLAGLSV